MARLFDGTNDGLQSSATVDLSSAGTGLLTLAFWMWWDSFANNDDLAFEHSANYNTNVGTFIVNPNSSAASAFEFGHASGAAKYRSSSFARPSTGVWHQYTLVFSTTAQSAMLAWMDGSAQTLSSVKNDGGATWGNHTLNFMCRNNTALYGAGRMAEVGIYNGTTTQAQATALAAGYPPLLVQPQNLLYYWPIMGNLATEVDRIAGNGAAVTGATKTAHPRIIYPSMPQIVTSVAAAPAGGTTRRYSLTTLGVG